MDSDMEIASLFLQEGRSVFFSEDAAPSGFSSSGIFSNAALAGAAIPLSASRFPQVAAAVAEIPDFQPVVPEKQMNLGGPGKRSFQVSE
jgi:hypothetical protein